jgi:hypothetical protein
VDGGAGVVDGGAGVDSPAGMDGGVEPDVLVADRTSADRTSADRTSADRTSADREVDADGSGAPGAPRAGLAAEVEAALARVLGRRASTVPPRRAPDPTEDQLRSA